MKEVSLPLCYSKLMQQKRSAIHGGGGLSLCLDGQQHEKGKKVYARTYTTSAQLEAMTEACIRLTVKFELAQFHQTDCKI